MKLNEVVNNASDLYELALKKIDNNKFESAKKNLQTVVSYYSKCIEKKSNFAGLYYKRALANKLLGNKFGYFIDTYISSVSGFMEAKKTYHDKKFQNENKNFINDKFTLVFELVHEDIIKEFTCSILDSKGYNLEKINLKINAKNVDEDDFEIDLENDLFSSSYQDIFSVLFFRLKLCDVVVSNNLNLNKKILEQELKNQVLLDLFEIKKSISLMDETIKIYDIQKSQLNNSEVFNLIFSKDIQYIQNSEINSILTSDCYRELKFKKHL